MTSAIMANKEVWQVTVKPQRGWKQKQFLDPQVQQRSASSLSGAGGSDADSSVRRLQLWWLEYQHESDESLFFCQQM